VHPKSVRQNLLRKAIFVESTVTSHKIYHGDFAPRNIIVVADPKFPLEKQFEALQNPNIRLILIDFEESKRNYKLEYQPPVPSKEFVVSPIIRWRTLWRRPEHFHECGWMEDWEEHWVEWLEKEFGQAKGFAPITEEQLEWYVPDWDKDDLVPVCSERSSLESG
jgi:hypothetical protein